MSENQEPNNRQNPDESNTMGQDSNAGQDLVDQLSSLGNTFSEVVQAAWNSQERQQIQQDLKEGLSTLAVNLEDGLRKASESQEAKEILGKAEEVVDSITSSEKVNAFTDALTTGLMGGLQALNEQMNSWSEEMNQRNSASNPAQSDVIQEIEIEVVEDTASDETVQDNEGLK